MTMKTVLRDGMTLQIGPGEPGYPSVDPSSPPQLAPLSPRQFWLAALSLGVTEEMVDAEIEKLPEPTRSAARIEKKHAQTYERTHSLVKLLPVKFSVTDTALDAAWRNAPA